MAGDRHERMEQLRGHEFVTGRTVGGRRASRISETSQRPQFEAFQTSPLLQPRNAAIIGLTILAGGIALGLVIGRRLAG